MQAKQKKIKIIISVILLLIILIMLYVNFYVIPLLSTLGMEEIESEVRDIINLANANMMQMPLYYEDYFDMHFDENKAITGLTSNTGLINQVNSIAQIQIQDKLDLLRTKTINIPLGAFTGSSVMAQFGGLVPINIKTIGNCSTKINGMFDTAGINQVRHRLVLTVNVEVTILLPIKTETQIIKNEMVIAENIISGEVPETLLMGDGVTDYLDLNP